MKARFYASHYLLEHTESGDIHLEIRWLENLVYSLSCAKSNMK
jgi:hypothetical protein